MLSCAHQGLIVVALEWLKGISGCYMFMVDGCDKLVSIMLNFGLLKNTAKFRLENHDFDFFVLKWEQGFSLDDRRALRLPSR